MFRPGRVGLKVLTSRKFKTLIGTPLKPLEKFGIGTKPYHWLGLGVWFWDRPEDRRELQAGIVAALSPKENILENKTLQYAGWILPSAEFWFRNFIGVQSRYFPTDCAIQ